MSTVNLVDDLLTEILEKLPVKSLIRFQSVCKSWKSIIKSKQFVKLYLGESELMVTDGQQVHHLHDDELTMEKINLPWESYSIVFFGSCNGLICLGTSLKSIYVWNPSIRVHRLLPQTNVYSDYEQHSVCGFGYDKFTDDYKVVTIAYEEINSIKSGILSLKTNTWRPIQIQQDFYFGLIHQSYPAGVLLNGVFHWLIISSLHLDNDDDEHYSMLEFDLATEKFTVMELSDFDGCKLLKLADIRGNLSLCNYNESLEIWVMNKRACWTKLLTITFTTVDDFYFFLPLFSLKNGEIIGVLDVEKLGKYDFERKTVEPIVVCDIYYDALVYKESLVSPLD